MPLNQWIPGEAVLAQDLNDQDTEYLQLVALWASMIFGTTSLQPNSGAITPTITYSSGLAGTVNVSGTAFTHYAIITGRICILSPQSFPVALNNATHTRSDVLYGTWSTAEINPFQRAVRAQSGTVTQQTCYELSRDVAWTYVQGNADGTPGAAPTGTVAVLNITVPAGGAELTSGSLDVVLPTINQLLNDLSPYVAGWGIEFIPSGVGGVGPIGGSDIYVSNSGVLAIAGYEGTIGLVGATGISVTAVATSAGPSQYGANLTVAPSFTNADGSVVITPNGASLDFSTYTRHFGGVAVTAANGIATITYPVQVLTATANVIQNYPGLTSYSVYLCPQGLTPQNSNFVGVLGGVATVAFYVVNNATGALAGAGVEIEYHSVLLPSLPGHTS